MATASPRRTVYLRGNADGRVMLDGPSLRVRLPGKSDQIVPLAQAARIHCFGTIEWDQAALLACARLGIPVQFLGRNGERMGSFQPPQPAGPGNLAERLEHSLVDPGHSHHLSAWLLARQKTAANIAAIEGDPRNRRHRQERVLQALPQYSRQSLKTLWADFESLVRADAENALRENGVDPAHPLARIRGLDLVNELGLLVLLERLPEALARLGRDRPPRLGKLKPDFARLAELHASMESGIRRNLDRVMVGLHRELLELGG